MLSNDSADDLRDQALSDEIVLLGELMLVATEAERPLSASEIDRALGVQSSAVNRAA